MSCVNMEQKERHAVCGNGIVLKMEDYMSKTLEEFEQYLDKMKKYEHINTPVSYTHLTLPTIYSV